MNRNLYRTIFSRRLGMLVAVPEIVRTSTKGGGHVGASRTLVTVAVTSALWGGTALAAPPLPTGGTITQGTGSISQSGNTLTVSQSTQSLSANWQSFDIAHDSAVVFKQPNSSSVALNRVVGPDASAIYGSLTENG